MHQETLELNCSRTSLALDSTLVVAVEMSLSTWSVCAEVPGLERRAMKKMSVDEAELLSQLALTAQSSTLYKKRSRSGPKNSVCGDQHQSLLNGKNVLSEVPNILPSLSVELQPLTSDVFLRNLLILFVPDAYRALHRPFRSDAWILLKR